MSDPIQAFINEREQRIEGNRKNSDLQKAATEFNIESLPNGIYLVVAEENGVRIETKKIVKH